VLAQRALDLREFAFLGEPFDGCDLAPDSVRRERHARVHRLAVEVHRARAARAAVAHHLRAGERRRAVVAQRVEQRGARLDADLLLRAVDLEFELHDSGEARARRRRCGPRGVGDEAARSEGASAAEQAAAGEEIALGALGAGRGLRIAHG
jgi:hypothetical protein